MALIRINVLSDFKYPKYMQALKDDIRPHKQFSWVGFFSVSIIIITYLVYKIVCPKHVDGRFSLHRGYSTLHKFVVN